jgi:hypothetical protein
MSTLQRISITTAALLLGTVGASAGQIPQYEVTGFPITPLQMSVLKSFSAQEQSPTPTLVLNGMPASPHQIAVTGPGTKAADRRRIEDASETNAKAIN